MHPLLKRFVIALVIVPPLLLVSLKVYRWWQFEYGDVTIEPLDRTRIQYPQDHLAAEAAMKRFASLSPVAQEDLKAAFRSAFEPVPDWLAGVNARSPNILCLGEDHDEYTRRFMSEQIFNGLKMDVLHLEVDDLSLIHI